MPSSPATVTIGATLGSGFLATFKTAEKSVTSLGKSVTKLDSIFDGIIRKTETWHASLTKVVGATVRLASGFTTATSGAGKYLDEVRKMSRENMNLTRAYDESRKALERLHAQQRVRIPQQPPPMPSPGSVPGRTPRGGGSGGDERSGFMSGLGSGISGAGRMTAAGGVGILGSTLASVVGSSEFKGVLVSTLTTANEDISFLPTLQKMIMDNSGINKTGQSSIELANAIQILVAANRDLRKEAIPAMSIMGEVATATGTGMIDIGKTTNSLLDNFKVAPGQLRAAFNSMAIAAKEGSFEFKDMAEQFPAISGRAVAALGLTGVEGINTITSAMQAIRKNTKDGSEAATNFTNLMSALTSAETKKKFESKGLSIENIVKGAQSRGANPLVALMDEMQARTGGDAFRLAEYFQDMQASAGMLALLQQRGTFNQTNTAQKSGKDVITGDLEKMRQNDPRVVWDGLKDSMFKVANVVAQSLAPSLYKLSQFLDRTTVALTNFRDEHPLLVDWIVKGGVALGGFMAVAGAGLMVLGSLVSTVTSLVVGWAALGAAFPAVAATLAGVGSSLMGVFTGVGAAIAAIGWPITLIVAGVVAAGALVYKYWEPIKAFMSGVGSGIMDAFEPIWEELTPAMNLLGSAIKGALGWFSSLFTPVNVSSKELSGLASIGRDVGYVIGNVVLAPVRFLGSAFTALTEAVKFFYDGFVQMATWVESTPVFEFLGDGFNMVYDTVSAVYDRVVGLLGKLSEFKGALNFTDADASISAMRGSGGKDLWEIRRIMMAAGGWKQATGDDELDTTVITSLLKSGALTNDDLRIVRNGASGKLGVGDNIDQPDLENLDRLIAAEVKMTARREDRPNVTNQFTTTVTAKTEATAEDIAKAADAANRKMSEDSSAKLLDLYNDSYD